MYCSNCGNKMTGKFCSNCGEKLMQENQQDLTCKSPDNPDIEAINIDIAELLKTNEYSKTRTITQLHRETGLSIKKCGDLVEEPYKAYVASNPKFQYTKKGTQLEVQADNNTYTNQTELSLYAEQLKTQPELNTAAKCPVCGSTSLSANKKGFGFGKAAIGGLIGPIGLLAGGIGSKKIEITCLSCGHHYKPGKL